MTLILQCVSCKNFINDKKFGCEAFKKIPTVILVNEFRHNKKFKGQKNNILYEYDKNTGFDEAFK